MVKTCGRKAHIKMNATSIARSAASADADLELPGEWDRWPHSAFPGIGTEAADVRRRIAAGPFLGDLPLPPEATAEQGSVDAAVVESDLSSAGSWRPTDQGGQGGELEWLMLAWGDGYEDIVMDGAQWRARRRDGNGDMFSAATADELDAALRADWAHREGK
ncbi:MAG: hypothetical protein JO345_29615 [Streptosporangiaceae bacterium]|nr:hypothetical protein [Streptosporangiaceae bacterium]